MSCGYGAHEFISVDAESGNSTKHAPIFRNDSAGAKGGPEKVRLFRCGRRSGALLPGRAGKTTINSRE
jgi:hypothetical protein